MTPEEKFNSEMWWVLQKIRYISLSTQKGRVLEWVMQARPIANIPPIGVREKMLLKIKELGGIRIFTQETKIVTYGKDFIYTFELLQPKFDEIYTKFQNACDINAWANTGQEKSLQNLKSGKDIDENIPKFLEVEKNLQLSVADRKKLSVLEKLKEEWDLNGSGFIVPESRYDEWINECGLEDYQRLEDILRGFQGQGLIENFEFRVV